MHPKTEDNERQASPTTACPAWCIGHNADAPGKDNDHLHEATPALMPCITLERTTNETGTIHLTWLIVGWLGCLGAGCCWDCGGCVGWGAH